MLSKLVHKNRYFGLSRLSTVALLSAACVLSACNTSKVFSVGETLNQGYIVDQDAIDATPVGSSREQVLLSLGTPSTTQSFNDNEVFYYISQVRKRGLAFQKTRLVSQSVLAVYFDDDATVNNIANYQLQDGKVFDMISRTTPTSGKEKSFLVGMLSGFSSGATTAGPSF